MQMQMHRSGVEFILSLNADPKRQNGNVLNPIFHLLICVASSKFSIDKNGAKISMPKKPVWQHKWNYIEWGNSKQLEPTSYY